MKFQSPGSRDLGTDLLLIPVHRRRSVDSESDLVVHSFSQLSLATHNSVRSFEQTCVPRGIESVQVRRRPCATTALIDFTKGADPELRRYISDRLVAIGKPALQPLISALDRVEPELQSFASSTLGSMGTPEVIRPLIEALADANPIVRKNAAVALGDIQDPGAIAPLIGALNDPDSAVRIASAFSLSRTGDSRAVGPLIAKLQDPDPEVRSGVSSDLGQFQGSQVVDALIAALNDRNVAVRREAAGALGQIEDPAAIAPLIQSLRDSDTQVKATATVALSAMGTPAIEPLIATMKDANLSVEELAGEALRRMKTGVIAVDPDTLRLVTSLESDFVFFMSLDNPLIRLSEITDPSLQLAVAARSPQMPFLSQLLTAKADAATVLFTNVEPPAFDQLFIDPSPLRLFIARRGTPGLDSIERTGGGLRVRFVESGSLKGRTP